MHRGSDASFSYYYDRGILSQAWSNYYPSETALPLASTFPTVTIPGDVVGVDNAEHHGFTDTNAHICAVGSTTSEVDTWDVPWATAFASLISGLNSADRGGLVVAHPTYTGLTAADVNAMLDYDTDKVLGIEAYNHWTEANAGTGWATDLWDEILATGRRCWGFFVFDHIPTPDKDDTYYGRNIVLMPSHTKENAEQAYRDGQFYGSMTGGGLTLTGLTVDKRTVTVETDSADTITMVTAEGRTSKDGPSASFDVPHGAVFSRFEATNESDTIYTQPTMWVS